MLAASCAAQATTPAETPTGTSSQATPLPPARTDGPLSLETCLRQRRSIRSFTEEALSLDEIGQLLWAAQGITDERGLRAAPSAGALYPLEVYGVTREGVFHYDPGQHAIIARVDEDLRQSLSQAALGQEAIAEAPLIVVITAVYERTEGKYGSQRGPRYVHLEAGHVAQNVLLEAVALGLGAVPIGAFDDLRVQGVLGLPPEHLPLYLIPVGHPR
jgi:SagB-type dehydrogenase family enzyme